MALSTRWTEISRGGDSHGFLQQAVVVLATLVGLSAMTAPTASAAPVAAPTPLPDRFYGAVPDLKGHRAGEILAVRARTNPPGFVDARTYQLKFVSTDMSGDPIAAITTLILPNRRVADGPLLSFQHVINAVGLQCAPSQALWTTDPNLAIREAPALNVALQRGWAVAIPDHLGPKSAYGAAKLGGRITLDGIRAVRAFDAAHLRKSPVAMAGYSGGGMATAWAAALQPTYAPDVTLAGAAYGGVPMNLIKMAEGLGYDNPHPAFGLAFAAAIGLAREYPKEIAMADHLTPIGRRMLREMQNACTNDILRIGAGHSARQVAEGGKQVFEDPTARRVVEDNSLSLFAGHPRTPVFEWHSPVDGLIPVASIDRTIARYCRAGVHVQTLRIPTPDHMTAAAVGVIPALNYLEDRFAGRPAPSSC